MPSTSSLHSAESGGCDELLHDRARPRRALGLPRRRLRRKRIVTIVQPVNIALGQVVGRRRLAHRRSRPGGSITFSPTMGLEHFRRPRDHFSARCREGLIGRDSDHFLGPLNNSPDVKYGICLVCLWTVYGMFLVSFIAVSPD